TRQKSAPEPNGRRRSLSIQSLEKLSFSISLDPVTLRSLPKEHQYWKIQHIVLKIRTMKADPEDVIAFVQVATHGSFSRAARELGVPKSSVSRRIQKLEQTLSTQLLQRTTRTLHLTEAGLAYYERTRRAIEELTSAEDVLEGMLDTPTGVLKLTLPIGLEEAA